MHLREKKGNTLFDIFLWSSDSGFLKDYARWSRGILGTANSILVYNFTVEYKKNGGLCFSDLVQCSGENECVLLRYPTLSKRGKSI